MLPPNPKGFEPRRDDHDCPNCDYNSRRWSDDVVERIKEWDALMTVASRLLNKSPIEIVQLVCQERDRRNDWPETRPKFEPES